jgi:ribosomal protein L24
MAGIRGGKTGRVSTMYQKQQGLAVNGENSSKNYIIETKTVIKFSAARVGRKKRG